MDIIKTDETLSYKMIEWKFNKADNSGVRYGMVAFGRSPNQKYVDCMYCLYKMDFKMALKDITKHSVLMDLFRWTTKNTKKTEDSLEYKGKKNHQNFFRLKALEGFYKEGLIEKINFVDSLEDIPDSSEN